jgi:hypothetical protein
MASFFATTLVFVTGRVALAEWHHVADCKVCHDKHHVETSNLAGIRDVITTPNSGDKNVIFLYRTGTNSYADGDAIYDGVCEVCHTSTRHHRNDGSDDTAHLDADDCVSCHLHSNEFSVTGAQSHDTHLSSDKGPLIDCNDCHYTGSYQLFADGLPLATTTACNACHSEGGTYDGVAMAKANWTDGIYEAVGTALKAGNEKWCASCHDDEPAYSQLCLYQIIIDDPDATFDPYLAPPAGYPEEQPGFDPPHGDSTTEWAYWWGDPDEYGNGQRYTSAAVGGTYTATWTPDIPVAGQYSVYAWWIEHTNRVTNATYTINHAGGSDIKIVDQEQDGGRWNYLGTYIFTAGTSGSVALSNDTDSGQVGQIVDADAVKFVYGPEVEGTYAPNVIGKDTDEDGNLDYGFFVTGHKINCLSCHDAGKKHIDNEHRTYDADESTGQAINPYSDSYRLQGTNSMPSTALCLHCHNGNEVLGEDKWDYSHTNLWGTNPYWPTDYGNGHYYHINCGSRHFDSDWDGVTDSRESCIACHNVHGSPARRMIRHGELISTYGTTDKVPALDFGYLVPTLGPLATATWPAPEGTYYVYAWWHAHPNRATNAPYTINHSGGSETIPVNQEENAIGFDSDGIFNPDPEIVIDNNNPSVTYLPEAWPSYSGNPQIYGADAQYHAKQMGSSMDRNATLQESVGGRMDMAASGVAQNGVCAACHGAIPYERDPNLGPMVLDRLATPGTVPPDGATTTLLTARVIDPNNDPGGHVTIDLSEIGGSATQMMYDDGTNGDIAAGDNIFSIEATVPETIDCGKKYLMVTATDPGVYSDSTGVIILEVLDEGMIVVDDPEAAFTPDCAAPAGYPDLPPTGSPPYGNANSQWAYWWGHADQYGNAFRYMTRLGENGAPAGTATWTPNLSQAGIYNVYAMWVANSTSYRSQNVTYTIHHSTGSTPVVVDQTTDSGQWNYLGTFTFNAGTGGYVEVDNDCTQAPSSGGTTYVIADAIMLELQPFTTGCRGDFDGDHDVDGSNLSAFAAEFGRIDCSTGSPCQGDFDNDGEVYASDLAVFSAYFGRTN